MAATKETSKVEEGTEKEKKKPEHKYNLSDFSDLVKLFREESANEGKIKSEFSRHLKSLAKKHKVQDYKIIFLFDERFDISTHHSNQIYEAIADLNQKQDILLVLLSNGGKIEPAYLISKTCKKLKKDKFAITIPRRAKSAATLISLGADELHMGLLSELGPIDPQFGGYPALGFSNALQRLAELASQYPESSEMFARYLAANMNLRDLGYFERINESAVQYAERLLEGKNFPNGKTPQALADHFTNHYKDHGFVIDADEAVSLLGSSMIHEGSKEYLFGNDVYSFLNSSGFFSNWIMKKTLRYLGSIEKGLVLDDKEENM